MLYGSVGAVYRPGFMISSDDWFMSAIIAYTSDARLRVLNELWVLISGKPMRGPPSPPPGTPSWASTVFLFLYFLPRVLWFLFSFLVMTFRLLLYLISEGAIRTFGHQPIRDDGQILIHVNVACRIKILGIGSTSTRDSFSLRSINICLLQALHFFRVTVFAEFENCSTGSQRSLIFQLW